MLEELTKEEETNLFLKSYKYRYNLFEKELTELFLKLYKEKYNLSQKEIEKLFLEVYKKHSLSKEELVKLFFKLSEENGDLFEEKLKESFLELYNEKHNLSEEALKESFLKSYQEKYNLSEEELLEFTAKKIEEIIEMAAKHDLLPVIKYFIENGGNPYFIIEESSSKLNMLNIAAKKGSLDIINYLLDNNIFTVDQSATEASDTPFHSAVEGRNIKAAELLLQKGADINVELKYVGRIAPVWCFVFEFNNIEMAKFLLKNGIYIPKTQGSDLISRPKIRDLLLFIKELENLQGDDFINAYNSSTPEIQEIWDARISHLAEKDSSIKIAGMSLDNNTAGDYS